MFQLYRISNPTVEEIGPPILIKVPLIASLMAPIHAPTLKKPSLWHLFTCLLKIVPSMYQELLA